MPTKPLVCHDDLIPNNELKVPQHMANHLSVNPDYSTSLISRDVIAGFSQIVLVLQVG